MRHYNGLIVLALLALLTACGEQQSTPEPSQLRTVQLYQVTQQSFAAERHFVGQVDAVSTVDLAFQVGGKLERLPVQHGQIVPSGQLIAALDPQDFQRQVREAQLQMEQARRDLERARPLREKGYVTPSELDMLQSAYDLANVTVENAERNLYYARLLAPFDALVSRRLVEQFSSVQAGTPIVRVQNVNELRVHIHVPEQLIQSSLGIENYDIFAEFEEAGQQIRYPLTYREHQTEVDAVTQTYQVTFTLPMPESLTVLPGMTLRVVAALRGERTGQTMVMIPLSALDSRNPNELRVWIYNPDSGEVQPTAVSVGEIRSEQLEVLDGLSGDETIVMAGHAHLYPGQQVRPFQGF